MTSINRREMIGGAVALLSAAHLPLAFAANQGVGAESGTSSSMNLPVKPKNLLSSTFTPELLSKSLETPSAWHPYPKAEEREGWQGIPQDLVSATVQRAEAILGTEWATLPSTVFLEYKRVGNRSRYERLNFTRRQRLADLVLGECVEGKGRFVDEIANGVWLTCEETFWGLPAHLGLQKAGSGLPDATEPVVDLFAAQTSATLAWTYYLVGAQLEKVSPLITKRIQIEAKRRILDPALARDDFWWMWTGDKGTGFRLNNWNPWINSNWMLTNLLLEDDPARRLKAMTKICKSLDRYLEDYSADGACEEGPGYWGESAASYFDCCSLLTSATGGAANVLTNPFIRKMVHYIADVHIANRFSVNYGDASAMAGSPGQNGYRMGVGTGDKVLQAFGAFTMPPPIDANNSRGGRRFGGQGSLLRAVPGLLDAAKARGAEKADALERDSWYPALCLMTARAKANSTDGFYLAVQATRNQRSHGHNDSGSFIVFHDGQPVFIDVGTQAYTAQTFSADRYKIWIMQSAYHNLPTVGGVMQQTGDPKYRASEVHYRSDDALATMDMNLATAYPAEAGITRWTRKVLLDRKASRILLNEDFQLQRKVPVALSFMTPRTPTQGAPGTIVLSSTDKSVKDVAIKFDASLVTATFEKVDVQDQGLKMTWGDNLYRVLLTSTASVDSGKWAIEIV